jgi:osomolarity two-component system, phosphorelay intermediate protein YPD1
VSGGLLANCTERISFHFFTYRSTTSFTILSDKGHFLKGSSASLGINRVKDACQKIEYLGKLKDGESHEKEIDEKTALKEIKVQLKVAKEEYATAEKVLRKYYKEKGVSDELEN